jgi:hypothetical protein
LGCTARSFYSTRSRGIQARTTSTRRTARSRALPAKME